VLRVEIKVEGHLDESWAEWLDGFAISHTRQGETVLVGKIRDASALYGLIAKLRDLGLQLISVSSGKRKVKKHKSSAIPFSRLDLKE